MEIREKYTKMLNLNEKKQQIFALNGYGALGVCSINLILL